MKHPPCVIPLLAFLLMGCNVFSLSASEVGIGPMLGHVGPEEARIWVQATTEAQLGIRIDGRDVSGPQLTAASGFMGHVKVCGLKPNQTYDYQVLLNGKPAKGKFATQGTLKTAPNDGQAGKVRVAFSSCYGRSGNESQAARQYIAGMPNLDLMLELGDNHYADSTKPDVQRKFYASQRGTPGWHAHARNLPIYAIWDDHDYGPNDSDQTAAGKEDSLRTFQEHWANPSYGISETPGIFTSFTRGEVQFFLLDDRYHRDPNNAPDSPTKTLLGKAQKAWIKEQLTRSTAKVKIVALGSETQLNGHRDSYTSFKAEQKEMLDFYKTIEGVILLSGDRHFSGAYQIRGETVEVTAGPMGSKNYPTKNLPDMFLNYGEGKLLGVLEIDTTCSSPVVHLEFHREDKGMLTRRQLTWAEINGDKRIEPLSDK
jgi:alkaline phosphatase D